MNLLSRLYYYLLENLELARHGVGANLQAMEGLRGMAILMVFFAHVVSLLDQYWVHFPELKNILVYVHKYGNLGVDLFFILSGYLIYGSLIQRKQGYFAFIKRRYIRLYPVYALIFVIYLSITVLVPSLSKLPEGPWYFQVGHVLASFLLLPPLLPIEPLITVAWSLSYELLFYFFLPVFIQITSLRSQETQKRVLVLVAISIALMFLFDIIQSHDRLLMFFGGMILFELLVVQKRSVLGWLGTIGLIASIGQLLVLDFKGYSPVIQTLFVLVALSLFCGACISPRKNYLQSIMCWTWIRWLGNMSYSFYLFHGLAMKFALLVIERLIGPSITGSLGLLLLVCFLFVNSFLVSFFVFKWIERPYSLSK